MSRHFARLSCVDVTISRCSRGCRYVSLLPEANGKRVGFEGVSMMTLEDGKIAEYSEVANVGTAFVELGFAPERTAKILAKEGAHLKKQPAFKRHLG